MHMYSQNYFLQTQSNTAKVVSIFHYNLPCSKIQFCPLPQLWKLSRSDLTITSNLPCVLTASISWEVLSVYVLCFLVFCLCPVFYSAITWSAFICQEYSTKQLTNLVNVCLGSHINKKARQKLLAAIDDVDRPKR